VLVESNLGALDISSSSARIAFLPVSVKVLDYFPELQRRGRQMDFRINFTKVAGERMIRYRC
jgi:hypothetical protein